MKNIYWYAGHVFRGEFPHQCEWVKVDGQEYSVGKGYFTVQLGPGAGTELVIKAKRYANKPTLAFPWHGETVPRAY